MDPIIFVILAAAMIGAAFYLVALPLLQRARRASGPALEVSTEQERLEELLAQREAVFQALRELNFDHRVGKITDEDFVAFEASLKRHAAETLRALDEWEAEADDDLDLAMEAEIKARREALLGVTDGHDEFGASCADCGKPASASDRFCSGCGADLSARLPEAPLTGSDTQACPACGNAYQEGDRFCGRCGQPLVAEPVGPTV